MDGRRFGTIIGFGAIIGVVALATLVSLAATPATGQTTLVDQGQRMLEPVTPFDQTERAVPGPWNGPRTPDGQPDVQGIWSEQRGRTMGLYSVEFGAGDEHLFITGTTAPTRGENEPPGITLSTGPVGTSMVADPHDGRIPYQPWAQEIRQDIADNYLNPTKLHHVDPVVRCFLEGTRNFYQSAFQILQPAGYVVIMFEFQHAYRFISLDSRPPIGEDIKLFMGDSRGHWEGNTLVVDVTNNNDQTWFDLVGSFHSDAMHIRERYTFVDADTAKYEATFTDPKVFTRPWTMAIAFDRNKEPGYELLEDACHEGERDATEMDRNLISN